MAISTPKLNAGDTWRIDNQNQIVDDLQDLEDRKVELTGDETIAGKKTFSTIPETTGGNPTTDNQLVRKAWIGDPSYQLFTSSGTWTKPSNCHWIEVEVVGGGGSGGGGRSGTGDSAGGGGGGGYSRKIIDVSAIANVTVTIGSGGSASASNSAGNTGGTSSFGAHCSATGGEGGQQGSSGKLGGSGGLGANGDINLFGMAGEDGGLISIRGGYGGGTFFAQTTRRSTGVSLSGNVYGGGSSGVYGQSASVAGANGVVIVKVLR